MKLFTNICVLILLITSEFAAFSQNWIWANSGGGNETSSDDAASTMCVDPQGNVYISGTVSGGDSAYFNTETLFVNGKSDIFIAKYDANGVEQWVNCFGGSSSIFGIVDEGGKSIAYDTISQSIFLTGRYIGNCKMGSDSLLAPNSSDIQIFVARFDLNGNCLWAAGLGSMGQDATIELHVFNSKIYLCGTVSDSTLFGSITIVRGGFLAAFDSSGNCNWAKNITNSASNPGLVAAGWITDIETVNNNLFVVIQKIEDTLYIGNNLFVDYDNKSVILGKLDLNGNILSLKKLVEPEITFGKLEIDKSGNLYLTGISKDTITVFETDTLYSSSINNIFVAKFDSSTVLQWSSLSTSNWKMWENDISTDSAGNSYVTGHFTGNAIFDGNLSVTTQGRDLFVIRYNTNGEVLGFVNTINGEGRCIQTLSNGSCVLGGSYFDSITLGSSTLHSRGLYDILVAKLDALTGISNPERLSNTSLYIYANPSTGKCNIKVPDEYLHEKNLVLSIYAINGKLVQQIPVNTEGGDVKVNIEAEAKGIYNAVLTNGKISCAGKIVFE